MDWRLGVYLFLVLLSNVALSRYRHRKAIKNYPKDTKFWATDFFVYGCRTFLNKCPKAYKEQFVCARSYNNEYKNFPNYCEMQYENCNTWRNWKIFKRERC